MTISGILNDTQNLGIVILVFVIGIIAGIIVLNNIMRKRDNKDRIPPPPPLPPPGYDPEPYKETPEQKKIKEMEYRLYQLKMKSYKTPIPKKETAPPVARSDPLPYDSLRTGRSRFSLGYWSDTLKERFKPHKTVLISMEFKNGFHSEFLVVQDEEGFSFQGKKYLFDNEAKYYKISSKLWCYDFHEDLSLPVRRKIPVAKIYDTVKASSVIDVVQSLNPSVLEKFIQSKISEGLMAGANLSEDIKKIYFVLIIVAVAVVGHLLIFMVKSGMFANIRLPGLG